MKKQRQMRTSYAKYIQTGKPFDKGKFIEEKLKTLADMDIALTEREMEMLYSFNSPRQIETFIRAVITNRWG